MFHILGSLDQSGTTIDFISLTISVISFMKISIDLWNIGNSHRKFSVVMLMQFCEEKNI